MVAGTGNSSTTIFNQYVDMFTFSDGPETAHPAAKAASATPPPSNPPSKGPTPLGVTYLEAVATTGSNKLICKTPNGTPNPLSPVVFPTPLSLSFSYSPFACPLPPPLSSNLRPIISFRLVSSHHISYHHIPSHPNSSHDSLSGTQRGMHCIVGSGASAELGTISGLGSLFLERGVKYTHQIGELVQVFPLGVHPPGYYIYSYEDRSEMAMLRKRNRLVLIQFLSSSYPVPPP